MARLDKALAEAAVSKGRSPPSPADILKSVLDILRYTVVFTTKRYTASVREMIAALKEHDYKQHRVKNYCTSPSQRREVLVARLPLRISHQCVCFCAWMSRRGAGRRLPRHQLRLRLTIWPGI